VRLINRLVLFFLVTLVKAYRLTFSKVMPPVCRFHPSCSRYALDALEAHGPFRGSWLALKRLSRCHPFHPGGLDPVPARRS
jgi:putative membrane protein insertion efficiency factor